MYKANDEVVKISFQERNENKIQFNGLRPEHPKIVQQVVTF